jgi:hypothetical protein
MPSDPAEGSGPPIDKGHEVADDADGVWTSFDDVKGWQMPFRTKGFAASKRMIWYAPTGLIIGLIIGILVVWHVVSTCYSTYLIVMVVVVLVTTMVMLLPFIIITRQMTEQFENLVRDTDLTPEETIARVESTLLAARMPFTRLSREDPDRYWRDEYSETFTISGGKAHVRVYDERPSGEGKATKVSVGLARAESERLVSTLAWRLDKALPGRKPL